MAELFSWVPLPYCCPPGCPFPIKSLALSAHVSPQTIHFRVLDKTLVSDPGRGPPSCNRLTPVGLGSAPTKVLGHRDTVHMAMQGTPLDTMSQHVREGPAAPVNAGSSDGRTACVGERHPICRLARGHRLHRQDMEHLMSRELSTQTQAAWPPEDSRLLGRVRYWKY